MGALTVLTFACHGSPSEVPTDEPGPSEAQTTPETIDFGPGFSDPAIRVTELSAGARVEVLAEGSGDAAEAGKRVTFFFDGYDAASGDLVMGTQNWPARVVLGSMPQRPIDVLVQDALVGLGPDARVRLRIPAQVVDEPGHGDLWLAIRVTEIDEPPMPAPLSAYAGEPIEKRSASGVLVSDFVLGEGPEARDGDRVEFHYLMTGLDGAPLGDTHASKTPVEFTLSLDSGVPGLVRGLRGARVGTLRKLEIPAEFGFDDYAPENFPRNTAVIMYVEITHIQENPELE